jgi:glycine dehydrogenase subunit 1
MRYLGLTDGDRRAMLEAAGARTIDDLYRDVPKSAVLDRPLDLPAHAGEIEVERALEALAARNLSAADAPCFLGAGAYRHHVPAAVDYIIQRGEFLTSYTPYQPEISQGTLQYLFEFQTQVALITGMEIASASHYDGATACAEAALMARRIAKRRKIVLSGGLHPHYRETTRTNFKHLEAELDLLPPLLAEEDIGGHVGADTAGVVVQNPDVFGRVRDFSPLAAKCRDAGALLVVVVTEPVSLGLMRSPGEMGADIVAAEGQGIGNGLTFGGPYLGLMATRERFVRQLPGRIAGQTTDADGRRGWVLTLSAREQHIRREKAVSNICTNSGLCALAFCAHLTLLGEDGFRALARLNHARAVALAGALEKIPGVEVENETFFNEFTVRLPAPAADVAEALAGRGILGGVPLSRLYPEEPALTDRMLVCATELTSKDDIAAQAAALKEVLR